MHRLTAAVVVALAVAGCGSASLPVSFQPRGPQGLVRVGLTELRWPLDPALVSGRDEEAIARAVFARPLRTDAAGALRPGLCTRWTTPDDGMTWRFRCAHAGAIAAQLARMRRLPTAPSGWLFAPIAGLYRAGSEVTVRLRFRWWRFPYALTATAAAPRGVPGDFHVLSGSSERVVVEGRGQRVVFVRVGPAQGVRAMRRGELDEAAIPLGDLRRLQLDPLLSPLVRVRPVLGVDLVVFQPGNGPLADLPHTRRVYWQTANRADYAQLVAGGAASPAFSLVGSARAPATAEIRQARRDVASLPPVSVAIATPPDPELQYAADTLVADWRELGLGPVVATRSSGARFERLLAAYPQDEALAAALLLREPSRARMLLLAALAQRDQAGALARVDAALRAESAIVPLAHVASARLVSPRLRGWRQDALGVVDYSSVRALAGTRRRLGGAAKRTCGLRPCVR